ncbi:MAG: MucB/RseB C-terminal domain-containing protein [Gammaproteobacteria bacterium]|nr:MucB/RseB C-terminal domain-containing protein [Gammaproteobacteria bacterium]MBU2181118.1 MucB/RseB C-terminal domain-containing protein [Gammaproteobacteria bacterium]MBU2225532.1 MucB/RseB C-terminal domain-containing protein [Gammaproteobacteria bacterium]MBU2280471.1 MucB/RseB C-terminal domain-containing protein [Gammaproteobacteria bacterium]MBU2426956.1 MucB/RseB C-terminal domain-containing protein [Gammaproteobacteria bacterium]
MLLALPAAASNDGWLQFERGQQAVRQFNFDLTFVQVRANQINTFRWLHGVHQTDGAIPVKTELEQLTPQDLTGTDTFRRGDRVYYATPDRPVQVTVNHYIKELPAILFYNQLDIMKLYDAVPGSSTSLSGRTAQLLRLTALAGSRFSYWLWLDAETGFPLRVDTVDADNQVLERWMVVHLQVTPTLSTELTQLLTADLAPDPVLLPEVIKPLTSDFSLNWLPDGYKLVSEQLPIVTNNGAMLASWLLTDGLHQISVFVQPSAGVPEQAYRDGATTILVQPKQKVDITVIGPLEAALAHRLANAVQ